MHSLEASGQMRILLADDHALVRQGLRSLLEKEGFAIVGEAADGREAIRLAATCLPDVLVFDMIMPLMNGIDAAREIMREQPGIKTILLTMQADDRSVTEALRAGISGIVLKSSGIATLSEAIREVRRGCTYIASSALTAAVRSCVSGGFNERGRLTARERQVLQLLAEGKATKEVAGVLGLSVKTAEAHRARIMDKLEIHHIAGLVRYAIRQGLIQP